MFSQKASVGVNELKDEVARITSLGSHRRNEGHDRSWGDVDWAGDNGSCPDLPDVDPVGNNDLNHN